MKKLLLTFLLLLLPLQVFAQSISISKEIGKEIYKVKNLGDEGKDEIIIGDELNPSTFKPQFKVTKWNKENSLTIRCDDIDGMTIIDGNKITTKNKDNDKEFYINPIDDTTLKFGVNFLKKPASNKIVFRLEGWEEFDFFYQPPLANVNPDGSTWENKLDSIKTRPVEVNGSYAIYHKTKRNHIIGQTNYKTGKFGHYYRPKFTDADGVFVWADLNIENGVVTVTIPQDFLDKAKYPIIANDWFGKQTDGASEDYASGNYSAVAFAYTTPASGGTLTAITIWCKTTGTTNLESALYANTSALPSTRLINVTSGEAVGATYAFKSVTFSYAITAGTQYWLGFNPVTAGQNLYYKYDDSTPINQAIYGRDATWADPFDIVYYYTERVTIYATYTPVTGSLLNNCVINNAVIQ